jgi:3-deoxy-D-manno-octulosonate 8-phosphate phosphatase (KDO 8-P phosphatase)
MQRASRVKLMLFDVDGVLTDGRLWYGRPGRSCRRSMSWMVTA